MAKLVTRGSLKRIRIDRTSSIPLYVQMRDALQDQIEQGVLVPGDSLPGDQELCEVYGVSRTVVRQALQELSFRGNIVRHRGRGTFIAEPKISSTSLVHSLMGFQEDMVERGLDLRNEVLEKIMLPATPKVAQYLELEPLAPIVRLERLRFVEGEPIVHVTSFLPYDLCPTLMTADLSVHSLYAFLEGECGLRIVRGRRRIEAVAVNEPEARQLQIETGAPMIRMESVSYLQDGRPVEYFDALFRGDRSRFELEVARFSGLGRLGEAMGEEGEGLWLSA
ncbi:MAG: GntR family transcriptional regulator [Anaerolineales bacterium]|nr:GntR family transcriptional regulator [Anaerolineales bacterium]